MSYKQWKRRFFRLDEEKLQYFENDGPDELPLKVGSVHAESRMCVHTE